MPAHCLRIRTSLPLGFLLMIFGCNRKPTPVPPPGLYDRPADIHTERILDWELTVNGVPVLDRTHTVRIGEPIRFQGHVNIDESKIAGKGITIRFIKVCLRPVTQSADKPWPRPGPKERPLEWDCPILKKEAVIDRTHVLDARRVPPGEYHARIYLTVEDIEDEQNHVDLIGRAHFTILPGDVTSKSPDSSK